MDALEELDEIEARLDRMWMLAARAAGEDCTDRERRALQEMLSRLRRELDEHADRLMLESR